ncbi:MAG TPA: HD domain-containing protein [Nitrososphaeraceae archaeon]|nr:HD domain-containing protein [Nitrososphaeraceae archaeon]
MQTNRIIRDPIYGFISLSYYGFIQQIVDTTYFQRLRRLSQLGVSQYVYPTATHSRLNHSLGAMELFVRLFDHLFKNSKENKDDVEQLRKTGIAAILLHDIGHGPFSHASEKIFSFNHEGMTSDIIQHTPIREILINSNIDLTALNQIITKTAPPKYKLLSQIISSQLDVDRLDYLTRDTYFTGVGFSSIDLERIILMMEIYEGSGDINGYAVINNKGMQSIESYVLSRHLMYEAVYYHKTTRCIELLIDKIFLRARTLAEKDKISIPEEINFLKENRPLTYQDIFNLDDHIIYSIILKWSYNDDIILQDLAKRVINRKPLKGIDLSSNELLKKYLDKKGNIESALKDAKQFFDPDYYLFTDNPADQPYFPYSPRGPDDETTVITNIFALSNQGEPREVSQLSQVINALSQKQYHLRVYFPREIVSEALSILGRSTKSG